MDRHQYVTTPSEGRNALCAKCRRIEFHSVHDVGFSRLMAKKQLLLNGMEETQKEMEVVEGLIAALPKVEEVEEKLGDENLDRRLRQLEGSYRFASDPSYLWRSSETIELGGETWEVFFAHVFRPFPTELWFFDVRRGYQNHDWCIATHATKLSPESEA